MIPVNGSRPFTLTVMLTVTVVTALAAVYAFSDGITQSTLTVTLPSTLQLREFYLLLCKFEGQNISLCIRLINC